MNTADGILRTWWAKWPGLGHPAERYVAWLECGPDGARLEGPYVAEATRQDGAWRVKPGGWWQSYGPAISNERLVSSWQLSSWWPGRC